MSFYQTTIENSLIGGNYPYESIGPIESSFYLTRFGVSFQGNGQTIKRALILLGRSGSLSGNFYCTLYLADPNTRLPVGSALATSTSRTPNTAIPTAGSSLTWAYFDFPAALSLDASQTYVLILETDSIGFTSGLNTYALYIGKNQNGVNNIDYDGRSMRWNGSTWNTLSNSSNAGTPPVSTRNMLFQLQQFFDLQLYEAGFSAGLSMQTTFTRQISRIRSLPAALKLTVEKIIDTPPSSVQHDLISSISSGPQGSARYIATSDPSLNQTSIYAQGFIGNGNYLEAAEFYIARHGISVGEVVFRVQIYQVGFAFPEGLLAESEPLSFNSMSVEPGWVRFVFVKPIKTVADTHYFVALAALSGSLSDNGSVDPRLQMYTTISSITADGYEVFIWQSNGWRYSSDFNLRLLFRVLGCPSLHSTVLSGFVRQLTVFRQAAVYMVLSAWVNRFFGALRSLGAGLNVSAGLRRILTQFRIWTAKTTLWSGLSRQFRVLRQFPAALKAEADLSRFSSALRGWSTKVSLQAALSRQFRVLRGFSAKLDVSAALKQLSEMLYGFTAELSLSASFELLRIPALRAAAFNAGLSVQSTVRRSVVVSRRFLSGLGLLAGFRRFVVLVRGFSASARLSSLFEALRPAAIREAVFSAGVSVQAGLSRQITLARQILTNLSVGAVLRRRVLGVRGWSVKSSVGGGFVRSFSAVRHLGAGLGLSAWFVRVFRVLRGFAASVSLEAGFRRFFVYVRGFTASLGLESVFMRWFGRLREWLFVSEQRVQSDIVEETFVHPDIVEEEIPRDL